MRYSAVTCLPLVATTDRLNLTTKTKKKCCLMWVRFRTAMLWWSVPQLDQPVSNKSMTAYSYQMSSIRKGSWESATWIQNCSTRTQFSCSMDHKLHTNVYMRVDTKRSVIIFFQSNQSLTVIFPPNYRRFTRHSTSFMLQQVYSTKIFYIWNLWKAKIWTGKSFTQLDCIDSDCAPTLTP